MAIDPADLEKIDVDLSKDGTIGFDQEIPVTDGSGLGNPPLAMSLDTLLRDRATATSDRSGAATGSFGFTTYNSVEATIDQDFTVTALGTKHNETCYMLLNKGADDIVTFSGAGIDDVVEHVQVGRTQQLYKFESIGGYNVVSLINKQKIINLTIANLTISTGTIADVNYFNWTVNDNICTLNASINIALSDVSGISEFNIVTNNVPFTSVYDFIPLNVYDESNYLYKGVLDDDTFYFKLNGSPTILGSTLRFSASFRIT